MKSMRIKRLPRFASEKEEADFWSTHSPLDYPRDFRPARLRVALGLKKRLISIRLNEGLLQNVKRLASKNHMPYQTFIQVILSEKIREAFGKAA